MNSPETIRLKLPRQELERSSYFDGGDSAVDEWVGQLRMANLGQTTKQLYQALSELNHVRMLPAKRMATLEKLRSPIYFVSRALSKHYLNQPVVLPEQARKVADLAYSLQSQLATGYTLVASHTAALGKKSGISKPDNLIAQALHRAITDHTLNIQRHYQLYEPVNDGVWYKLHQFYLLAKQCQVLEHFIEDKEFTGSSVAASYIRGLLIGCCKPNQLRQEDFNGIFKPLTDWASLCQIEPINNQQLFAFNPNDDRPPLYRELYTAKIDNQWLSLNTSKLTRHLSETREAADPDSLKVGNDYKITLDLLGHLILSWGTVSKRNFMRLENHDNLELCVGLSATHHFVSGELSFEALVEERGAKTYTMQQDNPFLKARSQLHRQKDVWDSPYESNVGQTSVSIESIDYHIRSNETEESAKTPEKYRSHSVEMINSSAHGYCIEWPPQTRAMIKTGEIVGIKEVHSHNWNIAVIRWVSHIDNQTQLGLELISPGASPYGCRIIRKTGSDAEYVRVLVLPAIPITKQPMTLITPRVPFRSGQKVVLNQRGKEVQLTLTEKLNLTGAYNQFSFKRLNSTISKAKPTSKDTLSGHDSPDDFDSVWGNL
ncbi:hypothetical protein [Oceanicoccus sp. KOV_DT_Chl]|uniref:hypothetical protein n=1 Tax=Oceanicoccus sp. KOV_DT_Chl TaxID=1904639 RepID=UPI000C7CCCA4|nr:hypothetical protein [Oceanicoccus sp. KOV_DT_Chl]